MARNLSSGNFSDVQRAIRSYQRIVSGAVKNKLSQRINEIKIDNSRYWAKKHWKSIYLSYHKAPFFNKYKDFFEQIYSKKWEKLSDLNEAIIHYLFKELDIQVPVYKSSDYNFKSQKTDLLIELCEKFGADILLTGSGAKKPGEKSYVEEEKFEKNNLKHVFSDFKHPVYPQQFEPFVSNMSVIDLLFNCGSESKEIIKKASDPQRHS